MDNTHELLIQFATHTILGKDKKYNTNTCEKFDLHRGIGIVVCDGVDGINNEGGALASKLATEGIKRHFQNNPVRNPIKALQGAMMLANFSIYDHAMKNDRFAQMGASVLLVIIVNNLIYYASAGNNTLLLQREGTLYQLIKQNNNDYEATGNILLGREKYTRFSICKNPVQGVGGDVILCASDGVATIFSDEQIAGLLDQDDISIELLSYQMIFKLEELQTADNATVALARLTDSKELPQNSDKHNSGTENKIVESKQQHAPIETTEQQIKRTNEINKRAINLIKDFVKNRPTARRVAIVLAILLIVVVTLGRLFTNVNEEDKLVKKRSESKNIPIQSSIKSQTEVRTEVEPAINTSEMKQEHEATHESTILSTKHLLYEHKVLKGENLYRISKRYNVSRSRLMQVNNLTSDNLRYDKIIKIPVRNIHTVQKGQTAQSIAAQYGITTQELLKVNQITNAKHLQIGNKLVIPLSE